MGAFQTAGHYTESTASKDCLVLSLNSIYNLQGLDCKHIDLCIEVSVFDDIGQPTDLAALRFDTLNPQNSDLPPQKMGRRARFKKPGVELQAGMCVLHYVQGLTFDAMSVSKLEIKFYLVDTENKVSLASGTHVVTFPTVNEDVMMEVLFKYQPWSLAGMRNETAHFFGAWHLSRGVVDLRPWMLETVEGMYHNVEKFKECRSISTTRCGVGDAFDEVERDTRPVQSIEWFILPVAGIAGTLGVRHSVLCVTVDSPSITNGDICNPTGDNSHVYVLEKAMFADGVSDKERERLKNGAFVSHLENVASELRSSFSLYRSLSRDDICGDNTIGKLKALVIDLGPYDLYRSNCHHAAMAVFNACAKDNAKVHQMPNEGLLQVMSILEQHELTFGASKSAGSPAVGSVGSVAGSTGSVAAASPPLFSGAAGRALCRSGSVTSVSAAATRSGSIGSLSAAASS